MHAALWAKLPPVTRFPLLAAVVLGVATACTPAPIAWDEPAEAPPDGEVSFLIPSALAQAAGPCPKSVRLAQDTTGGGHYAVWWAPRPDSTADLVVAQSPNGVEWGVPVKVDTLDAARTGCRRLPPAIAADAGNVHVAYAMAAKEGPGICASHSMDRGKMFHSPVAVVYGERIGLTDVAARGNLVAVAYEDPNTSPRRIGIAVSNTMAHLFQSRSVVSPPTGEASGPRVTLRDSTVTVTWTMVPRGSALPRRMMRRGTVR